MARPSARVIDQREFMDGTCWQILEAEYSYIITYRDRPVGIRVYSIMRGRQVVKYKKLTFTNLGNARRQVEVLNHKFKCRDFALIKVGAHDEI